MKLKLRQYLCNIKHTFRDEGKPIGLAVGVLMTELCSLFDFGLFSTQWWSATKTQFFSWNGWLVLMITVISINHTGHQACWVIALIFDWWAHIFHIAFRLNLVCMLIHLPTLIPHLPVRARNLTATSNLVGTYQILWYPRSWYTEWLQGLRKIRPLIFPAGVKEGLVYIIEWFILYNVWPPIVFLFLLKVSFSTNVTVLVEYIILTKTGLVFQNIKIQFVTTGYTSIVISLLYIVNTFCSRIWPWNYRCLWISSKSALTFPEHEN